MPRFLRRRALRAKRRRIESPHGQLLWHGVGHEGFRFFDALHVVRDGAGIAAFALRKSMISDMPAEDLACIDGHRAVEKYRDVRQASGSLQTVQVEQEALCSPHRECWDDHRSTPSGRATEDFSKSILGI